MKIRHKVLKFKILIALCGCLIVSGCEKQTDGMGKTQVTNNEKITISESESMTLDKTQGIFYDSFSEPNIYESAINKLYVRMDVTDCTETSCELDFKDYSKNGERPFEIMTGEEYYLQIKQKNDWVFLPRIQNDPFTEKGLWSAPGGKDFHLTVNWESRYGKLSKGEYRIIKPIISSKELDGYTIFYLSQKFCVK